MGDGGAGGDPERRATEPGRAARQAAAHRPGAVGRPRLHRAAGQPVRRRRRRRARGVVERAAQPVAVLVRPRRRATCGSPTSARTRSRRSTSRRRPAAATPARARASAGARSRATCPFNDDVAIEDPVPPFCDVHARRRRLLDQRRRAGPRRGRSPISSAGTSTATTAPGRSGRSRCSARATTMTPGRQVDLGELPAITAVVDGPDGEVYALSRSGRGRAPRPADVTARGGVSRPRPRRAARRGEREERHRGADADRALRQARARAGGRSPMASASATTMPIVEPSHVPNRPSRVASVIVASIVLSPSSARKNTNPTVSTTWRAGRAAAPLVLLGQLVAAQRPDPEGDERQAGDERDRPGRDRRARAPRRRAPTRRGRAPSPP